MNTSSLLTFSHSQTPLSLSISKFNPPKKKTAEKRNKRRRQQRRERDAASQVKAEHAVQAAAAANVRRDGDRPGGTAGRARGALRLRPGLLLRGLQVPKGSIFFVFLVFFL